MAWETRARGGRYYRRSVRVAGKVKNEYLGTGPVAELVASIDAERREREEAARQAEREEAVRLDAPGQAVGEFCEAVERIAGEILTAAGFHRPKRGAWRRLAMGAKRELPAGMPPTRADAVAIIRRAEAGEADAMAQVRAMADGPFPALWEAYGNLADNAANVVIGAATAGNVMQQEGLRKKLAEVEKLVAGEQPSALEVLLAKRVAICWLQSYYEDCRDAEQMKNGGVSLAMAEAQSKRAAVAQKRYLAAIRTLAQVRKLQLPTIQVNVGAQQLNVAG